jgi:hypothetical protein
MREIKKGYVNAETLCLSIEIQCCKDVIFSILSYRFNAITVKFYDYVLINKLIIKFSWKYKRFIVARTTLKGRTWF